MRVRFKKSFNLLQPVIYAEVVYSGHSLLEDVTLSALASLTLCQQLSCGVFLVIQQSQMNLFLLGQFSSLKSW